MYRKELVTVTKYIGHRGSLGYGVENTIAAFMARIPHNIYGLECDIRISNDGSFFIMHDDDLKRLANVNDKKIWEYSDVELNSIILSQSYHEQLFTAKIAFLEEYLKICKANNLFAIIEIKYSPRLNNEDISYAKELFSLIAKYGMTDHVIIISFMEQCLIKLRKEYPTIPMQLLVCGKIDEYLDTCIKYHFGIDSCLDKSINRKNIHKYHEHNLPVNIWTIDDDKTANSLRDLDVDFITTNILY